MKKIYLIILSFILIFLVSCKPHIDNKGIVHVGESCKAIIDSDHIVNATYISCEREELDEFPDKILIIETVSLFPKSEITISDNDFLLSVGYDCYENDSDKFRTNIEFNLKKNQYNIFEDTLSKDVTYSFCFIVPKENGGTRYDEVGTSLLIFHRYRLVHSFNQ